jgi:hypothetical protein
VQWLHKNVAVPTLHRLPNCKVEIRSRDHRPAHVHILLADGREVLVVLADMSTDARQKVRPAEIADALAWIATRAAELTDLFEELQR